MLLSACTLHMDFQIEEIVHTSRYDVRGTAHILKTDNNDIRNDIERDDKQVLRENQGKHEIVIIGGGSYGMFKPQMFLLCSIHTYPVEMSNISSSLTHKIYTPLSGWYGVNLSRRFSRSSIYI